MSLVASRPEITRLDFTADAVPGSDVVVGAAGAGAGSTTAVAAVDAEGVSVASAVTVGAASLAPSPASVFFAADFPAAAAFLGALAGFTSSG